MTMGTDKDNLGHFLFYKKFHQNRLYFLSNVSIFDFLRKNYAHAYQVTEDYKNGELKLKSSLPYSNLSMACFSPFSSLSSSRLL